MTILKENLPVGFAATMPVLNSKALSKDILNQKAYPIRISAHSVPRAVIILISHIPAPKLSRPERFIPALRFAAQATASA